MWDWRFPIEDIKKEIRKARTSGETNTSLDNLENLLDQLTNDFTRLEKDDSTKTDEEYFQEFVKSQKEVIVNSYEQAQKYTNVVIFGGYAGLFTIWNFTKEELPSWSVLVVGASLLLSICIYITFELYMGWLRTTQTTEQIKALQEAEKLHEFPESFQTEEKNRINKSMDAWKYFYYPTVFFALVAGVVLITSFFSVLWCNYA